MKNKYIAAILNFLFYGAGYLYLGTRKLFGALLLVAVAIWLAVYFTDSTIVNNMGLSVVSLVLGIAFAVDAYNEAQKTH